MKEEYGFSEESEYGNDSSLSINEIILRHIRKISDLSCKEFIKGYWDKRPIKTNTGIMYYEVYHEDVREAYCNAIDFLIDLIYPLGDKSLKKYLEKYEGFGDEGNLNEEPTKEEIDDDVEYEKFIKRKLVKKRKTFRQINIMFNDNNFWKGSGSYSE